MIIQIARAAEYTLIAPIPGPEGVKTATGLASYLQALFPFLLSVAAGLAFVMIVVGGIFYMTSAGNPAAVGSAKERIKAALIGLLIAVSSYLIINAINPNLLTLDFSGSITPIPSSKSSTNGVKTNGSANGGETEAIAKKIQSENADDFSTSGDCSGVNGRVHALTNLNEAAAGAPTTVCQSGCKAQPTTPLCTSNAGVKLNANMMAQVDVLLNDNVFRNQTQIESLATGDHSSASCHYSGDCVDITLKTGATASYKDLRDFMRNRGGEAICDKDGQTISDCGPPTTHVHVRF